MQYEGGEGNRSRKMNKKSKNEQSGGFLGNCLSKLNGNNNS